MAKTNHRVGWIVVMIAAVVLERSAASAEIEWSSDVNGTWRQAVERQQPMLVFATMRGCGYCEKMQRDTFHNQRVAAQVSANFRPVVVRAEEGERLLQELRVTAFPTTLIVSPQGRVIARLDGYVPARELERRLQEISRNAAAADASHAQR